MVDTKSTRCLMIRIWLVAVLALTDVALQCSNAAAIHGYTCHRTENCKKIVGQWVHLSAHTSRSIAARISTMNRNVRPNCIAPNSCVTVNGRAVASLALSSRGRSTHPLRRQRLHFIVQHETDIAISDGVDRATQFFGTDALEFVEEFLVG